MGNWVKLRPILGESWEIDTDARLSIAEHLSSFVSFESHYGIDAGPGSGSVDRIIVGRGD